MKYSPAQEQMILNGNRNGLTLNQIQRHPDFIKEGRKYAADKVNAYKTWTAEMFLSGGNDGAFKDREERERAFGLKVQDERGEWRLLYDISPAYRDAIAHKASRTGDDIMGIHHAPAPKSLERQAQERVYQAKKERLAELSNSKDPLVAAEAELQAIQFLQDPAWKEIRESFEPAPRPLEDWIKSQGPMRVQVGAQNQADCDAQNEANAMNPNEPAPESVK